MSRGPLAGLSPFLDAMSQITSVKKTETILPIAQLTCDVTALLAGDDLTLRSSLTSPVGYDRDMAKLLHSHSNIRGDGIEPIKYSFEQFCQFMSNIDKLSLMWALYKSTYEVIATDREIRCPGTNCEAKFKTDIALDELIHEDTYTLWDEIGTIEKKKEDGTIEQVEDVVPFYQYFHSIRQEYGDFIFEFLTKLPSIRDNNRLMSTLSTDVLQYNLEKIGNIYSRSQQMALLTHGIKVTSKTNKIEPIESYDFKEILITCDSYVPKLVMDDFFKNYGEKFDKYVPKYYKKTKCPTCAHEFDIDIDLEIELIIAPLCGNTPSKPCEFRGSLSFMNMVILSQAY